MKKVSVIIPLYNLEELVVKALNSIPVRDDIEVIVVDDCSQDNSYQVVSEYAKQSDLTIKLLRNDKNRGVGYTFNVGLDNAEGEFFTVLDSDDYFYTDVFNSVIDTLSADITYYDIRTNNGVVHSVNPGTKLALCGNTKFYKRSFIGNLRCPEIRYAEDKALYLKALEKNPSEEFTGKVVKHYNHPRENSLCYRKEHKMSFEDTSFINVFYQGHINSIGGVETFLYELARLSYENHRDFTIIYKNGDGNQIRRLRKFCKVLQIDSVTKPIRCKRAFFNWDTEPIGQFKAEEYIQIIHADFKFKSIRDYDVATPGIITKRYAVSENSAKSFREMSGKEIGVLYNPISIDKEPKVMTLVSAQRFTAEKGEARVATLINRLDEANIPYVFHIFSNKQINKVSPNVMYHEPTLDIRQWLQYADYTVLLSDTEGFPYTAYESLLLGTPLIITKLPILSELGANETNSIALDFDMSNLDVREIYNRAGKFKFKYEPKKSEWLSLITGEASYTPPATVKVQVTVRYKDMLLNRIVSQGEVLEVDEDRAKLLVEANVAIYME